MPWSTKQHKLFEFVKHNPGKARAEGIKIKQADASRMAAEGVKHTSAQAAVNHIKRHHIK